MTKAIKIKIRTKEEIMGWLFLLPSLIGVSIFILQPFIDAVRRSFTESMSGKFIAFQNYSLVLRNEAFKLGAGNTIKFLIVCIPLLLLCSMLLSSVLINQKKYGYFIKTSYLIPMSIPVASVVLLWKVVFHKNGLLNGMLHQFGLTKVDWLNTNKVFYVLVFGYIWKNCGYNMVLWLAGLNGISTSMYEAAAIDGCSMVKKLIYVTLPNLRQTFVTVTILSLINSFKVFREAYLIAGNYPHDSIYMLQHLFNNWFISMDVQKMCAVAVMMTLVILVVILFLQWISGDYD